MKQNVQMQWRFVVFKLVIQSSKNSGLRQPKPKFSYFSILLLFKNKAFQSFNWKLLEKNLHSYLVFPIKLLTILFFSLAFKSLDGWYYEFCLKMIPRNLLRNFKYNKRVLERITNPKFLEQKKKFKD